LRDARRVEPGRERVPRLMQREALELGSCPTKENTHGVDSQRLIGTITNVMRRERQVSRTTEDEILATAPGSLEVRGEERTEGFGQRHVAPASHRLRRLSALLVVPPMLDVDAGLVHV